MQTTQFFLQQWKSSKNNINNDNVEYKINSEIACINEWLKCNKLSLNISKCKYMIFYMPQKRINQLQLNIENIAIDQVSDFNCCRKICVICIYYKSKQITCIGNIINIYDKKKGAKYGSMGNISGYH